MIFNMAPVIQNGGGVTNVVAGEFTVSEDGTFQTVTIPYTGNGYILAFSVFLKDGPYSSDELSYRSITCFTFVKNIATLAPTYTGSDSDYDGGCPYALFKTSSSDGTAYNYSANRNQTIYTSANPATTAYGTLKINSKNTFSIRVGTGTAYGFWAGKDYAYIALYSE